MAKGGHWGDREGGVVQGVDAPEATAAVAGASSGPSVVQLLPQRPATAVQF